MEDPTALPACSGPLGGSLTSVQQLLGPKDKGAYFCSHVFSKEFSFNHHHKENEEPMEDMVRV